MAQVQFSYIGEPAEAVVAALRRFEKETRHTVKLHIMQWEYAWPELLSYALHGHGPDLSHVGSTWVGSLVRMNALRPFREEEIEAVGGARSFLPACWNSVLLAEGKTVWALPWTAYTFLVLYRRDLLARAGLDGESAFGSAAAVHQTLSRLQEAKVKLPWVVPSGWPHVDTLHMLASWVWGAGGDFIAADGRTPAFTRPEALAGIRAYFELDQFMPGLARNLTPEQTLALFSRGEAAVTVGGIEEPYALLDSPETAAAVRRNLGVACMPDQPWVGGDHLVIWQHAGYDPEREKAAVALAQTLVSRQVQGEYSHCADFAAPTRLDALDELPSPGSPATRVVEQSLRVGRSYPAISLWSRVETQLSSVLTNVWLDLFNGVPVDQALKNQLVPVARRLESALSETSG